MDYIKLIFFIAASIFPILLLINGNIKRCRKLNYNLLVVNFILLFIVGFKLHHQLRGMFNIPNTVTYFLGAIPFIVLFKKHYSDFLKNEIIILFLSLLLLSMAVLIDLVSDGKILEIPDNDFIEEIFRIAGAFFWLLFNYFLYSRLKTT